MSHAPESIFERYGRAVYAANYWRKEAAALKAELAREQLPAIPVAPAAAVDAQASLFNADLQTEALPLSQELLAQFANGGKYYGLWMQVARSLGVSDVYVRNAACGRGKSAAKTQSILAALRKAMKERDRGLNARVIAGKLPMTSHAASRVIPDGSHAAEGCL
jgi:hypothetical protein